MNHEWILALIGGIIIGISVSIMLLFNGRVTGISGIIFGILTPKKEDLLWRITFLLGLFIGGIILNLYNPIFFQNTLSASNFKIIIAGLLVGFGTILGSGCTSGHGICGMSRLSIRSILATLTFIFSGIITVLLLKKIGF